MADSQLQANKVNRLAISDLFSSAAGIARSPGGQNWSPAEQEQGSEVDKVSKDQEAGIANPVVNPTSEKDNNVDTDDKVSVQGTSAGALSSSHLGPGHSDKDAAPQTNVSTARDVEENPGSDAGNREGSDGNTSKTKNSKSKKDRSKLRKGKWTVEEEEYTSRIIHHFSTGLLSLPEGTTLRSYLAEKLNCDPMRITKKYAGASCLGKRVYHLCDRSPATVTDIEMAKAELARLEHRFRLRVEHGQNGMPLPPSADVIPSLPNGASNIFAPHRQTAAAAATTWLQSFVAAAGSAPSPESFAAAQKAPISVNPASTPWALQPQAPASQLLPVAPNNLPPTQAMTGMAPPPAQNSEAIAALAWAQAAAALTPALSQLAAANIQQHQQHQQQLQKAFQAQLQACSPPTQTPAPSMAPQVPPLYPSKPAAALNSSSGNQVPLQHTAASRPTQPAPSTSNTQALSGCIPAQASRPVPSPSKAVDRSKEDEDAGSMLMGFLTSLRQNFEDALQERRKEECSVSKGGDGTETALTSKASPSATHVTGLSRASISPGTGVGASQNSVASNIVPNAAGLQVTGRIENSYVAESSSSGHTSHEDTESSTSDSLMLLRVGKKVDQSSSEDSDREQGSGDRGYGPPRKRHKHKGVVGEFTSQNIAEHNDRMDAIHGRVARRKVAPGADAYVAAERNSHKRKHDAN